MFYCCRWLLIACLALLLLCLPTALAEEPITYKNYYPDSSQRPNECREGYRSSNGRRRLLSTNSTGGYVPFIGTSVVRDGQLLIQRLYYSIDYPVKTFILVVAEHVWTNKHRAGGLGYQLQHLQDYADNIVVFTCTRPPAVTEGWNAVFQAFPEEPWGIYNARDTAWRPGALAKVSEHMWKAVADNSIEVAYFNWTTQNYLGTHNAFAMTRAAINRFGLFDENIYPAFAEDDDFRLRQGRMDPPMRVTTLLDVQLQHGSYRQAHYDSGFHTKEDPGLPDNMTEVHHRYAFSKQPINNHYLYRKWGCPGKGPWFSAAYKTPFNKSVPVWYWEHSKSQREQDFGLQLHHQDGNNLTVRDAHMNVVYEVPESYAGWSGYLEKGATTCRLTGRLGVVGNTSEGVICI